MNRILKRNALIAVMSCLLILFIFGGCTSEREYNDDIRIQLETQPAEIIIREWSYLLGSGAEVYYKDDDKEILLGDLLGGDDGFCPFKEGLYSVTVADGNVTIEWCRFPNNKELPWDKSSFELPSN